MIIGHINNNIRMSVQRRNNFRQLIINHLRKESTKDYWTYQIMGKINIDNEGNFLVIATPALYLL